jgi:hypothetical protein
VRVHLGIGWYTSMLGVARAIRVHRIVVGAVTVDKERFDLVTPPLRVVGWNSSCLAMGSLINTGSVNMKGRWGVTSLGHIHKGRWSVGAQMGSKERRQAEGIVQRAIAVTLFENPASSRFLGNLGDIVPLNMQGQRLQTLKREGTTVDGGYVVHVR